MADDEQALVARIAADDQEALRILYTRYRPRLWRYLWRRLDGDAEAVEDALQETWLAIWRGAPGYRPHGLVAAWIFQITHRHVAHVRRDNARTLEGRLRPRALDSEDDELLSAVYETGSHEERVLDRLALVEALRALSPAHREVLELVFHHGFALAEVAQILDIPLGTVKSRVSYARRALATAFASIDSDSTATDATLRERTKR
jgi:RNA polymerase sigma-70 factor (ECF subfamily)